MRYPCLVKKRQCKTPVKVSLEQEELSVYGEPVAAKEIETTCNYQDSAKTVLTAEKADPVVRSGFFSRGYCSRSTESQWRND